MPWLLLLLALPPALVTLAGWAGGLHWAADLCRHFPLPALLALLPLGLGLCWCRWRLAGLGLLLLALSPFLDLVPLWLGRGDAAAPPFAPLRVMAINLLRENGDHAAVLRAIAERDPDVIALSELTPSWDAATAPLRKSHPHFLRRADPGWFGIALHSRLPLRDGQVLPLGFDWAPAIRAIADTATGPVGILAIHPPRPGGARRCAERDAALAAVPGLLAPLPPRRIVLGDANATPWSSPFRAMCRAAGLDPATAGHGWQGTWPAGLPWPLRLPLDQVLVTDGIGVPARGTGPDVGSDHLPVWADLLVGTPR